MLPAMIIPPNKVNLADLFVQTMDDLDDVHGMMINFIDLLEKILFVCIPIFSA